MKDYNYCKEPAHRVLARIEDFRINTSVLPSVGLSEITTNEEFDVLWEDHVPERRRWYELAAMLKAAGWERKRMRSLFYQNGAYLTKVGSRWFPPTTQTQD